MNFRLKKCIKSLSLTRERVSETQIERKTIHQKY
jgi:hypothetical protein